MNKKVFTRLRIDTNKLNECINRQIPAIDKKCDESIVAGLVVRHGDLSHEITLSHEGRRPECGNVNRV